MPAWAPTAGVALVLGLIAFALAAYRSTSSPDLLADDLIYSSVGRNIAGGHGLTVQGQEFFWQPPLFPLLLAPVTRVFGLTDTSPLSSTLDLRILNAAFAGVTAIVLFLFVRRLWNARAGVVAALLYATDPYVLSVTRHLYIEPMAMLLVIAALWLVYESLGRWTLRRCLLVGAVFGLALLTKEITFYALLIPGLLVLQRQMRLRQLGIVAGVAACTYGVYAVWAVAAGYGQQFTSLKVHQTERFLGLVRYTGINAPGHSLPRTLQATAGDEWSSYLLLALAVPAAVWLWRRRTPAGRFLADWYAVSLVMVLFLGAFGTLNPQFVYYVMIPTTAVVAVVAESLAAPALQRAVVPRATRLLRLASLAAPVVVIAVVLAQASWVWTRLDATGYDNGYLQMVSAIDHIVPARATIGVPRSMLELLHFAYPTGRYRLLQVVNPGEVRRHNVRWYVMSSKDPDFGDLTSRFYNDVAAHGRLRWNFDGQTFHRLGLWSIDPAALTGGGTP